MRPRLVVISRGEAESDSPPQVRNRRKKGRGKSTPVVRVDHGEIKTDKNAASVSARSSLLQLSLN